MIDLPTQAGRALIAAGGTGGHVYPALAVAGRLLDSGWSVDWVGTERGIEQRLVPAAGIPLHHLSVSGMRGKSLLAKGFGTLRLLWAVMESLAVIRRVKPDVVLGMGGYAAGPAGMAAWLTRRPLVIHEQNAVAGTTNRLLAPLARRVLCGLSGRFAAAHDAEVVGNPVRDELQPVDRRELNGLVRFSAERPMRLLVLGGSLGAAPLNALLPQAVDALRERGVDKSLTVWQQCGQRNRLQADEAWRFSPFQHLRCDDYIDDMASAYGWADVVIARAGALTVSELAQTGTASILIPLPHAIDDHQTVNARVLQARGAAVLMPQRSITPHTLADVLEQWIVSPRTLAIMSVAASAAAQRDATTHVAAVLTEVAHAKA